MDEDCRETVQELHTYLDGECGQSLEAVIRHHLERCPPCHNRADFERHVRSLLASSCRESAPAGLVERVLGLLQGPAAT